MIVYWNGQFLPKDQVNVSPDDRGFLFGDGVYEVVRIYGGRFYEMTAHEKRLIESANAIGLPLPEFKGMGGFARELLDRQSLPDGNGVLYYQISRGAAPRKHFFPDPPIPASHYAYIQALPVPDLESRPAAIAFTTEDRRWSNCHIKSIALLGSVLAAQEAKDKGGNEAILHREGVVTEGSHTNVFAVVDGVLRTHPANQWILNGINRRVVIEQAKEAGILYSEDAFTISDLKKATEIFLTGTTVEIWPVVSLDSIQVGHGQTGPVARELQKLFDRNKDRLT